MPKVHRTTGVRECLVVVVLCAAGMMAHAQPSSATATLRITLTIPERIDSHAMASLEHCGEIQARQAADGLTTRVEIQCRETPSTAHLTAPEPGLVREVLVAPI